MADNDTGFVKQETPYSLSVQAKLIEAFNSDYTVSAACRYAGCTRQSYYNWLKDVPGFAETMEDAQNKLMQKAGEVIAKNINDGDANLAFKFMQARDPRYKAKAEVTVTPDDVKKEERYAAFLDDGNDDLQDDSQASETTGDSEV